ATIGFVLPKRSEDRLLRLRYYDALAVLGYSVPLKSLRFSLRFCQTLHQNWLSCSPPRRGGAKCSVVSGSRSSLSLSRAHVASKPMRTTSAWGPLAVIRSPHLAS